MDIKLENKTDETKIFKVNNIINLDSFDDEMVLATLQNGMLILKGSNLQINNINLDEGCISIEGIIGSINFIDESSISSVKEKGKWWKRVWKKKNSLK